MATDELKMRIVVEDGNAKKKLKEVKKEAENTGRAVEGSARRLSESIFFNVNSFKEIFNAGKKLYTMVDQAAARTTQIGRSSFFTGISTEKLQKVGAALQTFGVNMSAFESSYRSMVGMWNEKNWGRSLGDDVIRAFNELGINPYGAKSPMDLLNETAEKLSKVQDTAKRIQLSGVLGIDESYLYAVSQGASKYNEIVTLTEDEIKKAKELNEELNKSARRLQVIKDKIAVNALTPLGLQAQKWLERAAEDFTHFMEIETGNDKYMWRDIANVDPSKITSNSKTKEGVVMDVMVGMLRQMGFSEEGIAGIIGNMGAESGFNPEAFNKAGGGKGAYGLFQWRGERQDALREYAKQYGKDASDPTVQLLFALSEMQKMGIYEQMKHASSVEEAVNLFESKFERSGGQGMIKRYERAGMASNEAKLAAERYRVEYIDNKNNTSSTKLITNNFYGDEVSQDGLRQMFGDEVQ